MSRQHLKARGSWATLLAFVLVGATATAAVTAVGDKVGIGTSTPGEKLEVNGGNIQAVNTSVEPFIRTILYSTNGLQQSRFMLWRFNGTPAGFNALSANSTMGAIEFHGTTTSGASQIGASIDVLTDTAWSQFNAPTNILIKTNAVGNGLSPPIERIKVYHNGNVQFNQTNNTLFVDAVNNRTGILTSSPSERLHVNGNLRLDSAFMPGNTAGTAGQVLQSNGAGVAPTWINNPTPTANSDIYPVPAMVTGAQDSRQAQTLYEGCIYTLLRPASFTTIHFRTLAVSGSPTVSIHLYADTTGAGVGTQTRRATVTAFATATANTNYAAPVSEGTATLPAGRFFVLWGSASAGTVTLRNYGTQAYDLLNTNVPNGVSPQTYNTALSAGTTPASINPASGTGDLVGSTNATCPVIRLN